jgi:hypothetical protein
MRVGVIRTGERLSVRAHAVAIEPWLEMAALLDSPAGTFGVAPSATSAELRQNDVGPNRHPRLWTSKGDGGQELPLLTSGDLPGTQFGVAPNRFGIPNQFIQLGESSLWPHACAAAEHDSRHA